MSTRAEYGSFVYGLNDKRTLGRQHHGETLPSDDSSDSDNTCLDRQASLEHAVLNDNGGIYLTSEQKNYFVVDGPDDDEHVLNSCDDSSVEYIKSVKTTPGPVDALMNIKQDEEKNSGCASDSLVGKTRRGPVDALTNIQQDEVKDNGCATDFSEGEFPSTCTPHCISKSPYEINEWGEHNEKIFSDLRDLFVPDQDNEAKKGRRAKTSAKATARAVKLLGESVATTVIKVHREIFLAGTLYGSTWLSGVIRNKYEPLPKSLLLLCIQETKLAHAKEGDKTTMDKMIKDLAVYDSVQKAMERFEITNEFSDLYEALVGMKTPYSSSTSLLHFSKPVRCMKCLIFVARVLHSADLFKTKIEKSLAAKVRACLSIVSHNLIKDQSSGRNKKSKTKTSHHEQIIQSEKSLEESSKELFQAAHLATAQITKSREPSPSPPLTQPQLPYTSKPPSKRPRRVRSDQKQNSTAASCESHVPAPNVVRPSFATWRASSITGKTVLNHQMYENVLGTTLTVQLNEPNRTRKRSDDVLGSWSGRHAARVSGDLSEEQSVPGVVELRTQDNEIVATFPSIQAASQATEMSHERLRDKISEGCRPDKPYFYCFSGSCNNTDQAG